MEKKCPEGLYYYDPCNEDTTDNDVQAKCGFGMFFTISRSFSHYSQGGSCSIYCENECNLGTTPSTTTTFTTMTTTAEKMTSTTGDLISTTSHGKFFICFIVTGNIKCNESSYGASNKFTLTLRKQLYVSPLIETQCLLGSSPADPWTRRVFLNDPRPGTSH